MVHSPNEKHSRLSDPRLTFAQKIKLAVSFELEYWESRQNPPNIPVSVFRTMIQSLPDRVEPRWEPRKSRTGDHGETGETIVFNFEYGVHVFGNTVTFYCKGYFFDKDDLKGVTVQSFRAVSPPPGDVIPMWRKK